MSLMKNLATVAASIIFCFGIQKVWANESRPEICYRPWLNNLLMDKLAVIAFGEARKRKIELQGYAGFIAVEMESNKHGKRPIYGLRFTPFACGEMAADGGGFDIEVDRKTLKVIDSYKSLR